LAIQTKPVNHLNPDASDRSCKIQLWNVNEARLERVLYEQDDSTGAIFSVEFSPDGKSLACAAWPTARLRGETRADGAYVSEGRLWDVVRGGLTRTREVGTKDELGSRMCLDLLKIAFSPDGKTIAGCGKLVSASDVHFQHLGGDVCLWDLESGKLKWRQPTSHTDIVYDVVFSP